MTRRSLLSALLAPLVAKFARKPFTPVVVDKFSPRNARVIGDTISVRLPYYSLKPLNDAPSGW